MSWDLLCDSSFTFFAGFIMQLRGRVNVKGISDAYIHQELSFTLITPQICLPSDSLAAGSRGGFQLHTV